MPGSVDLQSLVKNLTLGKKHTISPRTYREQANGLPEEAELWLVFCYARLGVDRKVLYVCLQVSFQERQLANFHYE